MKENALKGMHTGGPPPLGYDVDPETKKLVINEKDSRSSGVYFSKIS
jgi:site-specific DNA recombinase